MSLLLILKLLVVLIFLILFLRRPSLTWGVGVVVVTTAVLLDTLLGTLGAEQTRAELGFFFYIISGVLFSGAAIWFWGLFRPLTQPTKPATMSSPTPLSPLAQPDPQVGTAYSQSASGYNQATTAFDRQMVYDEIRQRFDYEDVLDLIFDLGINENDVVTIGQEIPDLIRRLMDYAETHELTGALALGVERILTPPPAAHLPRAEKIGVDSPPTILRQYLLATYKTDQLQQLTSWLGIDWEQLRSGSKKTKVRSLLQYLYRRNRLDELIVLLQKP